MEITFNTQIVDISVALKALKLYREGDFLHAINALQEVLDMEPQNWQARLMLAACYYKTNQFLAASRAFRFIYDQSTDAEVKKKALEALHATNLKLQANTGDRPAEFGAAEERSSQKSDLSWLEE